MSTHSSPNPSQPLPSIYSSDPTTVLLPGLLHLLALSLDEYPFFPSLLCWVFCAIQVSAPMSLFPEIFLFILATISSKLSVSHCPVPYSCSKILLITCIVFVSPTVTFYDFWKNGPQYFKAWDDVTSEDMGGLT